jgi:hypothetical protein
MTPIPVFTGPVGGRRPGPPAHALQYRNAPVPETLPSAGALILVIRRPKMSGRGLLSRKVRSGGLEGHRASGRQEPVSCRDGYRKRFEEVMSNVFLFGPMGQLYPSCNGAWDSGQSRHSCRHGSMGAKEMPE